MRATFSSDPPAPRLWRGPRRQAAEVMAEGMRKGFPCPPFLELETEGASVAVA